MRADFLRAAGVALLLAINVGAHAETLSFAVFGDTPYRHWERENLPQLMAEMDAAKPAFAINIGDIKGSDTPCSDATFIDILNLFQSAAHPLIYTPGDNEWTDCARGGGNYEPQERLARLRQLFHGDDYSLGQKKIRLERQSSAPQHALYRENTRWQAEKLLFLTLNVPGSRNNIIDTRKPSAEYLTRNAAVLDWLAAGFRQAREQQLPGIVIFMHADPGLEKAVRGGAGTGYADLLKLLVAGNALLSMVRSCWYTATPTTTASTSRWATRQAEKLWATFTRLETYGSPFMGWIEVTADTYPTRSVPLQIAPIQPDDTGQLRHIDTSKRQ